MTLLQINNLSHYFGALKAVDGFNITLEEGELVGLIGPNGAGKTTIFNLVTGAYRASEGEIVFQGQNLVGKPPHAINAVGISRTFQTIRLWNMMSTLDNVRVAHHAHLDYSLLDAFLGLPRYWRRERDITEESLALLRLFGLIATRTSRSKTCRMARSGGSRSCARWPPSPSCCCSTSRRRA